MTRKLLDTLITEQGGEVVKNIGPQVNILGHMKNIITTVAVVDARCVGDLHVRVFVPSW